MTAFQLLKCLAWGLLTRRYYAQDIVTREYGRDDDDRPYHKAIYFADAMEKPEVDSPMARECEADGGLAHRMFHRSGTLPHRRVIQLD